MLRVVVFVLISLLLGPAVSAAERFSLCQSSQTRTCVIDGDTFRLAGQSIRIMDIDAPETHPSRCAREADLGGRATERLIELLNAGDWHLQRSPTDHRNTDRYGRKLRLVIGPGGSIGQQIVDEGLARAWTGKRRPWC